MTTASAMLLLLGSGYFWFGTDKKVVGNVGEQKSLEEERVYITS